MAAKKVTVSLDEDLLAEVRATINGHGTLSAYLNDALRWQLQNDFRRRALDELDAEVGPLTEVERQEVKEWLAGVKGCLVPDPDQLEELRQKLKSQRLKEYLEELDKEFGPLTEEEIRAGQEWLAGVRARIEPGYK